jgi:hypothetical protein
MMPTVQAFNRMFQHTRHFTPELRTWDESVARSAITEIAADAVARANMTTLWPSHPMDDGLRDGNGSLYFGGAGVVWTLDYLRRVHAIIEDPDLELLVSAARERNAPWFATTQYCRHASLLMGELGILLVQMRIAPDQGLADEIYALLAANSELPIVELMWGLPGCMLACIHMQSMTGDPRFIELFRLQAGRLLADLEPDDGGPIWTGPVWTAAALAGASARVCGQHAAASSRLGLADAGTACCRCRSRTSHPRCICCYVGVGKQLARDCA